MYYIYISLTFEQLTKKYKNHLDPCYHRDIKIHIFYILHSICSIFLGMAVYVSEFVLFYGQRT